MQRYLSYFSYYFYLFVWLYFNRPYDSSLPHCSCELLCSPFICEALPGYWFGVYCLLLFCFWAQCDMWNLSSLIRDQTRALCSDSMESQPLGSPWVLICITGQFFIYTHKWVCVSMWVCMIICFNQISVYLLHDLIMLLYSFMCYRSDTLVLYICAHLSCLWWDSNRLHFFGIKNVSLLGSWRGTVFCFFPP